MQRITQEKTRYTVLPEGGLIFRAFHYLPPERIKVVILGQDPYHRPGQAHGLAFSVPDGVRIPPSLRNIFRELQDDTGTPPPASGSLIKWEEEGVLLLNTLLTVRQGSPGSHTGLGWESFTAAILKFLSSQTQPMVFLLWGNKAKEWKADLTTNPFHLILEAPHPSPLSAWQGFLGCRHFSRANAFLSSQGVKPVRWDLSDKINLE